MMPPDGWLLVASLIVAVAALGTLAWQAWVRRHARQREESLRASLEEGRRTLAGLQARTRVDERVLGMLERLDRAPPQHFDAALEACLGELAQALGARRCAVMLAGSGAGADCLEGWGARAPGEGDGDSLRVDASAAAWLRAHLLAHDGVAVSLERARLPAEARSLESALRARGTSTAAAALLRSRGDDFGVLLAEHAQPPRRAHEEDAFLLDRAAAVLGPAVARHRAEAGAREDQSQLATVLDHAPVAMFVLDPRGRIQFARGRALGDAGIDGAAILGASAFDLLSDSPRLLVDLERGLSGQPLASDLSLGSRVFDARLQPVIGEDGLLEKLVLVVTDTTERRRIEERLLHETLYDRLTGLPNRTLFADRLTQRLARGSVGGGGAGALLLVSLDRFVALHDALGTASSERYLLQVARVMRDFFPDPALVARVDTDEFAVHAPGVADPEEARALGRELQSTIRRGVIHEGRERHGSASIGIAPSDRSHRDAESWLREAHTAMVVVQRRGGGAEELFRPVMHTRVMSTWKLEEELNRAISRDEIEAWFQPIVRLVDGAPIGFEALARWRHADAGMIPPGQFIPVAEDNGMIGAIGWIMLRNACKQLRAIHEMDPEFADLYVSVNASPRQLADRHFLDRVKQALRRERLEPRHLQLEITERDAIGPGQEMVPVLRELRELGVCLSLDDFGTGYSSLSYLNSLPAETMKVDRSFVVHMHESPAGRKVITAILLLSQGLGLKSIAEGVETEEQRRQLLELGCELGQGYLFSRPLEAGSLREYLGGVRA